MLRTILNRNLLKYSAGHSITCPKCGQIADYRRWVIWESPGGQHGAHCAECHRKILAQVHDDDAPHDYLISIGWQFNTLVDFSPKKAKPRKPAELRTKAQVQKAIHAGHKRERFHSKTDRVFPIGYGVANWPMRETTADDGTVSIDYTGDPVYSAHQISEYVRKYCELNHLTQA
jgi:DNA-directed RNA polymerase subunit RPC12/RpoP